MKQLLIILLFLSSFVIKAQNTTNYSLVSKTLLQNIIDGKSYEKQVAILEKSTLDELVSLLKTDTEKIAFWINIYNSFIHITLTKNPELFEDRDDFFGDERVKIAGEILSFDDIEHGIIRKSTAKLSLGYIQKPFRAAWERKLRVENIDWRIHFALNCGAKSCPPVAVYSSEKLDEQLEFMTKSFLKDATNYNSETKEAFTTILISWFRGDFGGIDGAKEILYNYKITPEIPESLEFTTYDWTLLLNNFRTIPE